MRYTYTSNIPWSQYATWYNNINDQKKNELDEELSEALQLGAKSYTEYKAMKEREEKRKTLEHLAKQNQIRFDKMKNQFSPEQIGKDRSLTKKGLLAGSIWENAYSAKDLIYIGLDINNKNYLENVKVYNKIEDLKLPKLKKTIKML